jgi:hypothetical protein
MKRLQFDMPEKDVEELDALVERTGLKTRAHLMNVALSFYEWAIRERGNGRIIASMDEAQQKYKEVEMPGFPPIMAGGEEEVLVLLERLGRYIRTPALESKYKELCREMINGSEGGYYFSPALQLRLDQRQEEKISRSVLGRQLREAKK